MYVPIPCTFISRASFTNIKQEGDTQNMNIYVVELYRIMFSNMSNQNKNISNHLRMPTMDLLIDLIYFSTYI